MNEFNVFAFSLIAYKIGFIHSYVVVGFTRQEAIVIIIPDLLKLFVLQDPTAKKALLFNACKGNMAKMPVYPIQIVIPGVLLHIIVRLEHLSQFHAMIKHFLLERHLSAVNVPGKERHL